MYQRNTLKGPLRLQMEHTIIKKVMELHHHLSLNLLFPAFLDCELAQGRIFTQFTC